MMTLLCRIRCISFSTIFVSLVVVGRRRCSAQQLQRSMWSFGTSTDQKKRSSSRKGFAEASQIDDAADAFVDYGFEDEEDVDDASPSETEVSFEDVRMTLRPKKNGGETRVILDGSFRGKASPGRMLAVMGPSGSGKTTLLHALAGRVRQNGRIRLSGSRRVDGVPMDGSSILPAAFVPQESSFFPRMTARETLAFRVELRLGRFLGKAAREELVEDLLRSLGLAESADVIVGDAKVRGLSGGERRRLSIACEMIHSPSVVFLDEPTSGLDSYQAEKVVVALRKLADEGKTVVAVIHQPSQKVFGMFDDLLLVSEGKQMYFGPTHNVRNYFENIGYSADDEVGTAEHVIDLISVSVGDDQSRERVDHIAAMALQQPIPKIDDGSTTITKDAKRQRYFRNRGGFQLTGPRRPSLNLIRQLMLLTKRSIQDVVRGKGVIAIKLAQQVTIAFIYGTIFKLGNNQASIMDRVGLLSLVTIGTVNMSIVQTIKSFPKEKAIVSTELAQKMYSTGPYFIAKAISELPLVGLYSSIFGSILYPLVGLQKGCFKNFIALNSLTSIVSLSAGLFIGSVAATEDVALALFPPILILNIIFDGKNISYENTPRFLRWIPKLGLIKWGFEGLVLNEFRGLTFEASKGIMKGPQALTGEQAIERLNIKVDSTKDCMWSQIKIIVGSWILSYLGLKATGKKFQVMEDPSV